MSQYGANHIRYHKGCLDGYMLKRIPSNMANDCINPDNENEHQRAFQIVMSEIQEKLQNGQAVYFVSQLCYKVGQYLIDNQVDSVFMYTTKKLVEQLQHFFGDKVFILPQVGTSSLLCSSTLTLATFF